MHNDQNKSNDAVPFCFYANFARSYELLGEMSRVRSNELQKMLDTIDGLESDEKWLLSDFYRHAKQAAQSCRQTSQFFEACAADLQTIADSSTSIPSTVDLDEINDDI